MIKNLTYRTLLYLLYAVFVMMAAISVGGCSDDDGDTPAVIANDVIVSFRVVTESQPQTRGVTPDPGDITWGDNYESNVGDNFDNTLLVEGFSVFVTDEACKERYAEVKGLIGTKSEETTGEVTTVVYNFVGEISATDAQKLITAGTGKLHVVANMPDFTSGNILNGKQPSFTLSGQPNDNFKAIPMWGVTTVNNFADMATMKNPNDQFYAGEVWLLRSMAKVEIEIDNKVETNVITELVEATVTGANGQGYLLPALPTSGWTGVPETKSIKIEETLREFPNASAASGIYTPDDNKKIIFYLSETLNSDGNNDIKINLTFKTGETSEEGTIHFAKYENGEMPANSPTYYNIVRNHLYRFSVRRKAQDTELTINYTVCPWHTIDEIDIPGYN